MPDPKINIAERSFAGNPVMLSLYVGETNSVRYDIYTLAGPEQLLFSGDVYSLTDWATIDISSVVNTGHISDILNFRVDLLDGGNNIVEQKEFIILPGGLSKLMRRKLISQGTDIFALKLKNKESNFFLSTRTFNTELFIPENELLPLNYYAKGMKFRIMASQNRFEIYSFDAATLVDEQLQTIDLENLRVYCINEYDAWPSDFRIMTDNGWACSIILTQCEPTPFFLKFLNSFGMWEKIALYFEAEYAPVFSEKEKSQVYDSQINDFKTLNTRKEITNKYRFNTRHLNESERLFLLDALLSKSTYLVANGVEYEAFFSTSTELFSATSGTPVQIIIDAQLVDTDSYFSPLQNDVINSLTTGGYDLTTNNADLTT